MDTYKAINDILVHLFNEIWELEEKAIITEEYKDITNNDMQLGWVKVIICLQLQKSSILPLVH